MRRLSGGGRKEIKEEYSSCERASPGRPLLQCPLTDSLNVPGLLENDRKTSLQTYSSLLIHLDINEKQENLYYVEGLIPSQQFDSTLLYKSKSK